MPQRKLKNCQEYLRRLMLFAEATGVKVEYGDIDSEGVWMPASNKIKLDNDLSSSDLIASLLHELGHSVDDMIDTESAYQNRLYKAYNKIYVSKASKKQKYLVIECEQRAWNNAREIAKRLKIRLGKWFDDAEKYCLDCYREN